MMETPPPPKLCCCSDRDLEAIRRGWLERGQ